MPEVNDLMVYLPAIAVPYLRAWPRLPMRESKACITDTPKALIHNMALEICKLVFMEYLLSGVGRCLVLGAGTNFEQHSQGSRSHGCWEPGGHKHVSHGQHSFYRLYGIAI